MQVQQCVTGRHAVVRVRSNGLYFNRASHRVEGMPQKSHQVTHYGYVGDAPCAPVRQSRKALVQPALGIPCDVDNLGRNALMAFAKSNAGSRAS